MFCKAFNRNARNTEIKQEDDQPDTGDEPAGKALPVQHEDEADIDER